LLYLLFSPLQWLLLLAQALKKLPLKKRLAPKKLLPTLLLVLKKLLLLLTTQQLLLVTPLLRLVKLQRKSRSNNFVAFS
jgi:hypothetical protein